jgi:hypothetical protein
VLLHLDELDGGQEQKRSETARSNNGDGSIWGVVGSCLARRLGKSGAGEIADGGFFLRKWSTRAEWCPEWSESLLDGRSENLEEMDLNQNRKGR